MAGSRTTTAASPASVSYQHTGSWYVAATTAGWRQLSSSVHQIKKYVNIAMGLCHLVRFFSIGGATDQKNLNDLGVHFLLGWVKIG